MDEMVIWGLTLESLIAGLLSDFSHWIMGQYLLSQTIILLSVEALGKEQFSCKKLCSNYCARVTIIIYNFRNNYTVKLLLRNYWMLLHPSLLLKSLTCLRLAILFGQECQKTLRVAMSLAYSFLHRGKQQSCSAALNSNRQSLFS